MKHLIFDTGPIISLATNNMLWLLPKLKKLFLGEFYITPEIKREIIERPIESKKFKFEALQVLQQLQDGVFRVYNNDGLEEKTEKLLSLANNIFRAKGSCIQIVHHGEMEVLAAALDCQADGIVIDERTTRVLIENPVKVRERLAKKLHTTVDMNRQNLLALRKEIGKMNVIRSFELATIAYENEMLKDYVLNIPKPRKELLEGVLWGVKLSGCSVSEDEIRQVLKIEKVL